MIDLVSTALWLCVLVALLITLKRVGFAGKNFFQVFVWLNFVALCVGFLMPFLGQAVGQLELVLETWFLYLSPLLSIAGYVFLLLFALALKRADAESGVGRISARPWYRPPGWLLATTAALSAACIVHNIDGRIMQNVVSAFVTVDTQGSGAAYNFARQLEFSGKVANAVGGLFIATVVAWIATIGHIGFQFFTQTRAQDSPGQ